MDYLNLKCLLNQPLLNQPLLSLSLAALYFWIAPPSSPPTRTSARESSECIVIGTPAQL